MPLRIETCPNCNHPARTHRPLEPNRDAHCDERDGTAPCACPLDRAAVGLAIGMAASLVKYG